MVTDRGTVQRGMPLCLYVSGSRLGFRVGNSVNFRPVSYTHLTLPTSLRV